MFTHVVQVRALPASPVGIAKWNRFLGRNEMIFKRHIVDQPLDRNPFTSTDDKLRRTCVECKTQYVDEVDTATLEKARLEVFGSTSLGVCKECQG
jgi:hypothetical protein